VIHGEVEVVSEHTTKEYGFVEGYVQIHSFVTFVLDRDQWSVWLHNHLTACSDGFEGNVLSRRKLRDDLSIIQSVV